MGRRTGSWEAGAMVALAFPFLSPSEDVGGAGVGLRDVALVARDAARLAHGSYGHGVRGERDAPPEEARGSRVRRLEVNALRPRRPRSFEEIRSTCLRGGRVR